MKDKSQHAFDRGISNAKLIEKCISHGEKRHFPSQFSDANLPPFYAAFVMLFLQASGLVWLLGGLFSFSFYTDKLIGGVSSDLGDIRTSLAIISGLSQALKVSSSVCTDITGI